AMVHLGSLWRFCALLGVAEGRRAVQVDHSLDVAQGGQGDQFCCCVEGICAEKYRVGPDGGEPEAVAVYNPNENLCCRLKDRSCGHVLNAFSSFKEPAKDKGFCQGRTESTFVAPPLPKAPIPDVSKMQPGHAAHTVHTYCDLGAETVDEETADSTATSVRRNVVQTMVNEVSRNSIDAMAKEIFSIYVCTRWAPTGDFARVMEGEMATGQLPKSNPSKLYKERRFLPLRCSSNFKVFEEVALGQTSFQAFEAQMEALAKWYKGEADGAVAHRLAELDGDIQEDAAVFDLDYVKKKVDACPDSDGSWSISAHTASG
ncbi:rskn-1, partial [Symbiodinium pilosum]